MLTEIKKAMILAAGRGTRMRSLTEATPKPLIKVHQKALINYVADKIAAQGIKECVVNLCYLGDQIKKELSKRQDIHFVYSEEEEALETGGGIKKALPFFQEAPFFALNSDPVWTESSPSLQKMLNAYDEEKMDILLLLWPVEHVFGHSGKGDYFIENGVPRRKRPDEEKAPFVYAGAQILHPRIFKDSPSGKFSLNVLYDKAERNARLSAVVGKGDWYHVGTPEALSLAEQRIPAS